MKPGCRIANPSSKKLAGTYRADRHGDIMPIVQLARDEPIAPEWLPAAAKAIWDRDLACVVACGATSVDSHMFALYCVTMADFMVSVVSGEATNAAFRSELRKQMEMLGIAGAKSRLAKIGEDAKKAGSPFSVRPQ